MNDAWSDPPASTEQIIHPGRYPNDDPVDVSMDGFDSRMGDGWSEQWQQTMGEARIGVWLADGAPPERSGPDRATRHAAGPVRPHGWGGDRLVSLVGPGDSWAVVWQTEWDSGDDASQFASAATDVRQRPDRSPRGRRGRRRGRSLGAGARARHERPGHAAAVQAPRVEHGARIEG